MTRTPKHSAIADGLATIEAAIEDLIETRRDIEHDLGEIRQMDDADLDEALKRAGINARELIGAFNSASESSS
jgi:hypothetical protein